MAEKVTVKPVEVTPEVTPTQAPITTEVVAAVNNEVSAEVLNAFSLNDNRTGFEDIDASDLKLTRIKVVQKTSAEADIDGISPGDFYNSTSQVASKFLDVVIYGFKKQRSRWPEVYAKGDQPLCISYDGRAAAFIKQDCSKCPYQDWNKARDAGKNKPECSENHVYYGVLAETNEPFAFSISGTGIAASKRFLTEIVNKGKMSLLFNIKLETVKETNDKFGTYFVVKFNIASELKLTDAAQLQEAARRKNDMVSRVPMFETVLKVFVHESGESIIDMPLDEDSVL